VNSPKQARSTASTKRMLDAAEAILANKGPDFLTVENVIEEAKTSMGSFYARFKNRDGLILALHNRFLETVQTEILQAFDSRAPKDSLEKDLADFSYEFFKVVSTNRKAFLFFVIDNSFNVKMRKEGQMIRSVMHDRLNKLIRSHKGELPKKNLGQAIDISQRMYYGLFLEIVMYGTGFAGNSKTSLKKTTQEYSKAVVQYLKS
jgi:AcrR family transcriptional regulator